MLLLRIIVSKWLVHTVQSALCFFLLIKTSMKQTSGQSLSAGTNICCGSAATRLCVDNCAGVLPRIHTQISSCGKLTQSLHLLSAVWLGVGRTNDQQQPAVTEDNRLGFVGYHLHQRWLLKESAKWIPTLRSKTNVCRFVVSDTVIRDKPGTFASYLWVYWTDFSDVIIAQLWLAFVAQ